MASTVSGQEGYLDSLGRFGNHNLVGGLAPWRVGLYFCNHFEAVEVVETAVNCGLDS